MSHLAFKIFYKIWHNYGAYGIWDTCGVPDSLNAASALDAYSVQPLKAIHIAKFFNSFHATDLFLHSLKISGNVCFSVIFGEYKKSSVASNGFPRAFICSKLTIEMLEEGVNMFKVNNKDTRTTPYLQCSSGKNLI